MVRPRREDRELVKRAQAATERVTTQEELRAAQAILLSAKTGATLVLTAALLGVGRANVARLQPRFRRTAVDGPPAAQLRRTSQRTAH